MSVLRDLVEELSSMTDFTFELLHKRIAGPFYRYAWGNNSKRATMKGRTCILLGTMSLGSVYIEFTDNGQREVTGRRALRRIP